MKKIILFGSQGLLGADCYHIFSESEDFDVLPLSHFNYNLLQPEEIEKAFADHQPDIAINCAGFTDVDSAELPENEDLVYGLNADAPKIMARLCKKNGVKFVHFSTDYVFNGQEGNYDEQSRVDPINVYGDSKLEGEMGIWEEDESAIVIRTSRLFGKARDNLVTKVGSQAKKNSPITAISDEIGNYTYTKDLAQAVKEILEKDADECGIFHLFGEQAMSPFEAAKEIVKLLNSLSPVQKISTDEIKRMAKRPKNCSLQSTRTSALPGFFDALPRFLEI